MSLYPWQQGQWQYLMQRMQQQILPHALLLGGSEGMGKQDFALAFAKRLLCQQQSSATHACQTCKACLLFAANHHPDFQYVAPQEVGKALKIDQIRDLTQFLRDTAQLGGYKVVVIAHAEALNTAAANALLKTLEEPEGQSVILLVTSQPSLLPATVRSRCHLLNFPPVSSAMAIAWLEQRLPPPSAAMLLAMADGAPLKALSLSERLEQFNLLLQQLIDLAAGRKRLSEVVKSCQGVNLLELLACLAGLLSDVIKLSLSQQTEPLIYRSYSAELKGLTPGAKLGALYSLWDEIAELRQQLLNHINLNQGLQLERILYQWQRCWLAT